MDRKKRENKMTAPRSNKAGAPVSALKKGDAYGEKKPACR